MGILHSKWLPGMGSNTLFTDTQPCPRGKNQPYEHVRSPIFLLDQRIKSDGTYEVVRI
jgi:hypothetical protein